MDNHKIILIQVNFLKDYVNKYRLFGYVGYISLKGQREYWMYCMYEYMNST